MLIRSKATKTDRLSTVFAIAAAPMLQRSRPSSAPKASIGRWPAAMRAAM